MLLINLGENAPFVFKHPYFFEDFTCKFEGWEPELKKELECFIKDLGGKISDDTTYIFTEYLYFREKQDRSCYYSINYLSQSIETEVPLDINNWRFIDLEQTGNPLRLGCCCNDIRTILKAKACYSDNFNSIVCTQCLRNSIHHHSTSDGNSVSEDSYDDIKLYDKNNFDTLRSSQKPEGGIDSIDRWKRKEPPSIRELDQSSENSSDDSYDDEQIINKYVFENMKNQKSEASIGSIERWKTKERINFNDIDTSSDSSCKESCCNKQIIKNNMSRLPKDQKAETSVGSTDQKIRKEQNNVNDSVTSSKNSSQDSCGEKRIPPTKIISIKNNDNDVSKLLTNQNSEAVVNNIAKQKRKQPISFSDTDSESSGENLPSIANTFRAFHSTLKKQLRKSPSKKLPEIEKVDPTNKKTPEVKDSRSQSEKTVDVEKNISTKNPPEVNKVIPINKKTPKVKDITSPKKDEDNLSKISKNENSKAGVDNTNKRKRKQTRSSASSGEELPSIASAFSAFHSTLKKRQRKSVVQSKLTDKKSSKIAKINLTNNNTSEVTKITSPKKNDNNVPKVLKTQNSEAAIKRKRELPKSFSDTSSDSSDENLPSIASTFSSFNSTLKKGHGRSVFQSKSTDKKSSKVAKINPTNKKTPEVEKIRSKHKKTTEVEKIRSKDKKTPEVEVIEEISTKTKNEVKVITLDSEDPRLLKMQKGFPGNLLKDIEEWWINLPPGYNPDPNYQEKEFKSPFPERDYVDNENRTMIAYLVKNDLYDQFHKRSTWRKMHRDGHLRPRSIDSLKAQIKVILANIHAYNLPKNIEQRFLSLNSK